MVGYGGLVDCGYSRGFSRLTHPTGVVEIQRYSRES